MARNESSGESIVIANLKYSYILLRFLSTFKDLFIMAIHPNWSALSTVDFQWKQFVRESPQVIYENKIPKVYKTNILSGEEAKNIYEEVIGTDSLSLRPTRSTSNQRSNKFHKIHTTTIPSCQTKEQSLVDDLHKNRQVSIHNLFKEAQSNNVNGLSTFLSDLQEVNVIDQYGWTVLMCAACAGAVDVVKYLLELGADINYKDKYGNSCMSLAKRHHHTAVIQAIESKQSKITEEENAGQDPEIDVKSVEEFFCVSCKQEFSNTTREQHSSSTVHLFNCHPRPNATIYGIPENNRGYQILLRGGWDKEKGLGPDGSGHKFPLKTVLKKDREGFGAHKSKSRVTHFRPRDTAAIRVERHNKVNKREREDRVRREKRKERDFRREFTFSI